MSVKQIRWACVTGSRHCVTATRAVNKAAFGYDRIVSLKS